MLNQKVLDFPLLQVNLRVIAPPQLGNGHFGAADSNRIGTILQGLNSNEVVPLGLDILINELIALLLSYVVFLIWIVIITQVDP